MNSQFEQALKVASHIGAQQAYDRIRARHGLEKSAAVLGAAAKGGGMANAFSGALKSKGGKAALLGTGLLGAGGAGAYGGAQYGKNKTIDTIKTNMDNQGLMDRLKTIFQYLMGNSGAVMNNLGLENKAPTGV